MLKLNPTDLLFKPRRADTAGAVAMAPDLAMWRLPFLATREQSCSFRIPWRPMSRHETAIADEMALTNLKIEPYHQFRLCTLFVLAQTANVG